MGSPPAAPPPTGLPPPEPEKHEPAEQVWFVRQVTHMFPFAPQSVREVLVMHWVPRQQPA